MKKALFILMLLFTAGVFFAGAQDVTHKDIAFKHKAGFLLVNDVNWFKLKYSAKYYTISDLESGEEVLSIFENNNETIEYVEDDYRKVFFSKSGKFFETKLHRDIVIANMINEKVITADHKIDDAKVDFFITKYDQNITNRTTR